MKDLKDYFLFRRKKKDDLEHAPKKCQCCKGLYVVINAHQSWLKDHYDGSQHFNQLFWSLWHDIALHFQSRDGHLIFEILNKPAQAGLSSQVSFIQLVEFAVCLKRKHEKLRIITPACGSRTVFIF